MLNNHVRNMPNVNYLALPYLETFPYMATHIHNWTYPLLGISGKRLDAIFNAQALGQVARHDPQAPFRVPARA